jgi:acetyl-CoA carboxylase biotin carboxyl carrier protein
MDGRVYEPKLTLSLARTEHGKLELRSVAVGLWRGGPAVGDVVVPGQSLGELEVLGRMHRLLAPEGAAGRVVEALRDGSSRAPVDYGRVLLVLDPEVGGALVGAAADADQGVALGGKVFPSPMSGRFWARPAPDKPPFVEAGAEITVGQTLGLLEVMKTFNRVVYGGEGLPERVTIKRVVPADGDDVTAGDPLLELE